MDYIALISMSLFMFSIALLAGRKLIYKMDEVESLIKKLEATEKTKEMFEDRAKELEDAIKEDYGITSRIIKKEVNIEFSHYERVLLTNAIALAIAKGDNVDVIRNQIELLDKMVSIFSEASDIEGEMEE